MESNKLEISSRTAEDLPPASYKVIPESDDQAFKERPKSLTKSLKSNSEMDGADEKMLPKDEKNAEMRVDLADVKFSLNEKQNGEAKLDIGDIKTAFVGMSKEELMKYANDPFWIRLRWVLFISFWLLWLAMLVGAIIIIIAAPKCAPPAPRTWYEEGPLIEIPSDFSDEGLEKLKNETIKTIIVSKIDDSFKPVNESTDLINLIQRAKKLDMNVIIELSPTASALWFNKSEAKEEGFIDYYIWSNYVTNNATGSPEPPNNWLSPSGSTAWKHSSTRDEFYYAPNDIPHLNFRKQAVVDEFSDIIRQWIDVGVKGIRLSGASSLLVHEKLQDEPISSVPGPTHDSYDFYKHRGITRDVEGLGEVLKQWKTVVREYKDNNGPLLISEDINSLDPYLVNSTLSFDLPRHSKIFFIPERLNNATLINRELNFTFHILGDRWPAWQFDEKSPALPADVLSIVVILLPGTVIASPDLEINPELLKVREAPSVMYGDTYRSLLANNTVFAYLRTEPGNPGYLVALNPTENTVTVDFTTMKNMSDEVTVQILSANFNTDAHDIPKLTVNEKISAKDIQLPPKSAILLTYVPKSP